MRAADCHWGSSESVSVPTVGLPSETEQHVQVFALVHAVLLIFMILQPSALVLLLQGPFPGETHTLTAHVIY